VFHGNVDRAASLLLTAGFQIPEALDWLQGLALPPGVAPAGRTHPTFIELGTNRPLNVHRDGSNVVNGRYCVDDDPKNTIVHYSSFRRIDIAGLRAMYREARATPPTVTPGSFSQTYVGDRTDTSPYPDETLMGISTESYIRNMSVLIRYVDRNR
jgi:hypothetical protein